MKTIAVKKFMNKLIMFLILVSLLGCAYQKPVKPAGPSQATGSKQPKIPMNIVYAGGNGSSLENAIIIRGASNGFDGVKAEYDWIKQNHPGWKMKHQALINSDSKFYDCMEFTTPEEETEIIYFDITDFFGKQ